MTPVALCLEELLPHGPETWKYRSASIFIRTALVISTIGVAVLVPFFGESLVRCKIFRVSVLIDSSWLAGTWIFIVSCCFQDANAVV